ncbi:MAG: HNH endonuclease [Bacteroidales bacterium]|nr:HNH endonuclease [Bacteroidales bacterium]
MLLYNTTKWRKCRAAHLVSQPLCQECLREGKVYAGSPQDPLQVHHIKSPFKDGKINWELALDDSNLETICSYHHGLEHAPKPSITPEQIIEALDALFAEIDDED